MTAPLRMSFDVACPAEHAFAVWTSGIGVWWPADLDVLPHFRAAVAATRGGRPPPGWSAAGLR